MLRTRRPLVLAAVCAALGAVSLASPAAAWDGDRELTVEVRDEQGEDFTFTLGGGLFGRLVAAALDKTVKCDASDTDPNLRHLLAHLDRGGEGSRGTARDRDGDVIHAWRRAGHLRMNVRERDGERADITLPWAMAQCMLGREVELGEVLSAGGDALLQVRDGRGSGVKVSLKTE
jgi:hypothetical protein